MTRGKGKTDLYINWGIFLICTFFYTSRINSQNLVPNPGFEILSECPLRLNGIRDPQTPPWLTPFKATNNGALGSSDIFNSCSNPSAVGVPVNVKGFQYPHKGNGYAGFISHESGGSYPYSAREYLQAPLIKPLMPGDKYYVGFYISLPDRMCAVKEVGMHFSKGPVPPQGDNIFNYEPQIESNQGWLNDTIGWMLIEGCFTAVGGEDYLTIGNFRTNLESKLFSPCPDIRSGYYYLDDVFVMNMTHPDLGQDFSMCPGDKFTLYAGGGNTTYLWQDGSTSDTFAVTGPGKYYVRAANICGTVSDTIIISAETNPPQIDLPAMLTLCQGDNITLDPNIDGVTFAWSNGSSGPKLTIDEPANYGLTVTNGCGSDVAHVLVIDGGPPPEVSLGANISICLGEILEIQPTNSNVDSWLWQDGSTSSSITISNTGPIYVTVQNECGMASDTTNVLQSSDPPELNLGADLVACEGEVVTIDAGVTGVSYLWQDGSSQPTITTSNPGTFSLQISNACGSNSDTIEVDFNRPPPFPFLGNDTTLCVGDVQTLQWNGPADISIQWDSGSDFPFYFIDQSGEYYITATNLCGSAADTIELTFINPPAPFNLGKDTILCQGTSIPLSVSTVNGIITWQDGSHQNIMTADRTQIYSAEVSNQCGTQTDSVNIEFDNTIPIYTSELTKSICPFDTIQLNVIQDFEAIYKWSTGSTSSSIEVNSSGKYDVDISTNCATQSFEFDIVQGTDCNFIPTLFIPNVFSPNGDGVNDQFTISAVPYIELFNVELVIYDRWGTLVFQSNSLPVNWDGTFKNKFLLSGVYTYNLKLINKYNGIIKSMRGDLTLIH